MAEFDFQTKVICIGNSGAGKSSLAVRFARDKWDTSLKGTVGVDLQHRIIDINGVRIRLIVWDSTGLEKFMPITRMFYRTSQGVLLVYDVSDYSSFKDLQGRWLGYLHAEGGVSEHMSRILVGNKTDSTSPRTVSTEQGQKLAQELGAIFCETSARSGENVMDTFMMLMRDIKRRFDENLDSELMTTGGGRGQPSTEGTTGTGIVLKPSSPESRPLGTRCTS